MGSSAGSPTQWGVSAYSYGLIRVSPGHESVRQAGQHHLGSHSKNIFIPAGSGGSGL